MLSAEHSHDECLSLLALEKQPAPAATGVYLSFHPVERESCPTKMTS